jgi:hypothetical protein
MPDSLHAPAVYFVHQVRGSGGRQAANRTTSLLEPDWLNTATKHLATESWDEPRCMEKKTDPNISFVS